ncbi:predicted protein [Chaetoceros tenuissimus]|uniref:Uncharacterized protein n=1 Tax=Chaetoceros tenuissimus TaxID=426638 RepID=A0AAD3HBD0_9STRA|nr:predicted protein [Chaetoceros tenuissimus]
MPETTYAKGTDRIVANSVAKKQLRSIIASMQGKYATIEEAPSHMDIRNQYPGLVKEWTQYKDWETKFRKYYKKQLGEQLGLKSNPKKGILKNPASKKTVTVSFADEDDVSTMAGDQTDDDDDFLEEVEFDAKPTVEAVNPPSSKPKGAPPPAKHIKKSPPSDRVEVCTYTTDFDGVLGLFPEVFDFNGNKIALAILYLPYQMKEDHIVVEIEGSSAKVKFSLDSSILAPSRSANHQLKEEHMLFQAIWTFRKERALEDNQKKGDLPTFALELDLPFHVEPVLASHLLYDDVKKSATAASGSNGLSHIQIIHSGPNEKKDANPWDFMDTLVLIFKEEESNFDVTDVMETMARTDFFGNFDDDDFWS